MSELERRRASTRNRVEEIRSRLNGSLHVVEGKACIYATGSFGRGEASEFSDLDLFIVGLSEGVGQAGDIKVSALKRLDEICIKSDLIHMTRALKIPEFSGDGKYLAHYSVDDFTKTLGTPDDDALNTFTARLLLLLESTPLLEDGVYKLIVNEVLQSYWRDYPDHRSDFIPAFLANDILRLWRTLCVNYEAQTFSAPDPEKSKRKLKNYKLKHSRLLTCYSAIIYLLAIYRMKGTVEKDDAFQMIGLSPCGRLEWLLKEGPFPEAEELVKRLLAGYEEFLEKTNCDEKRLLDQFMNPEVSREFMDSAYGFGDLVFKLINSIGGETRFHRILVV